MPPIPPRRAPKITDALAALLMGTQAPGRAALGMIRDAGTRQREGLGRIASGKATPDDAIDFAADYAMPMAGSTSAVRSAVSKVASELPMDEASRMARAEAQGFKQGYYKGLYPYDWRTGKEIDVIQRQEPFPTFTPDEQPYKGIAGFLTQDPEVANRFAVGGSNQPAVMPLAYKSGNTLTIDANGAMAGDMQFGKTGKPFRDAVRSGKYDTIVLKNTKDEGDVTVALKPENIRSRFAKFDPANIGKAGLMGGLAALLTGQREEQP